MIIAQKLEVEVGDEVNINISTGMTPPWFVGSFRIAGIYDSKRLFRKRELNGLPLIDPLMADEQILITFTQSFRFMAHLERITIVLRGDSNVAREIRSRTFRNVKISYLKSTKREDGPSWTFEALVEGTSLYTCQLHMVGHEGRLLFTLYIKPPRPSSKVKLVIEAFRNVMLDYTEWKSPLNCRAHRQECR